jgi:hypothetical protein
MEIFLKEVMHMEEVVQKILEALGIKLPRPAIVKAQGQQS